VNFLIIICSSLLDINMILFILGKQFETPEKSLTSLLVKNYHDLSKHQKDVILEIVDDPCGKYSSIYNIFRDRWSDNNFTTMLEDFEHVVRHRTTSDV